MISVDCQVLYPCQPNILARTRTRWIYRLGLGLGGYTDKG